MDARTGVERQPQSLPLRVAPGKSRSTSDAGVAVADATATWMPTAGKARESGSRISLDPMRSTDRYRLVMPYDTRC